MTAKPYGWWIGLALTLLAGTALCAIVGTLTFFAELALRAGDPAAVLLFLPGALLWSVFAWPFVAAGAALPIAAAYALLRALAPHIRMTPLRRAAIGALLGCATNLLFLALDPDFERSTGRIHRWALSPPTFEILTSALALALAAPARWFGLPRATPPRPVP